MTTSAAILEQQHQQQDENHQFSHPHHVAMLLDTTVTFPAKFPSFSASNTNSGTQNTIDQTFTGCAGYTMSYSLCSSDGGVCNTDTWLRLYNAAGSQVSYNDDSSCGLCSKITYTFNEACQTYTLKQGCSSAKPCSGQVAISVTGKTVERCML